MPRMAYTRRPRRTPLHLYTNLPLPCCSCICTGDQNQPGSGAEEANADDPGRIRHAADRPVAGGGARPTQAAGAGSRGHNLIQGHGDYARQLAPQDGLGPLGGPGRGEPSYGIRPRASKGPAKPRCVGSAKRPEAQPRGNSHRRLLNSGHRQKACKGLHMWKENLERLLESRSKGMGGKDDQGRRTRPLTQTAGGNRHVQGRWSKERQEALRGDCRRRSLNGLLTVGSPPFGLVVVHG